MAIRTPGQARSRHKFMWPLTSYFPDDQRNQQAMPARQSALQVPGPPPVRLFGSQGNFVKFLRDPVGYMRVLHDNYGDVATLVEGSRGMIFAFGPQFNQQILSNPTTFLCASLMMPGPENSAQRRLSNAVFSMNNEAAMSRRRLLMPPFHKRSLAEFGIRWSP